MSKYEESEKPENQWKTTYDEHGSFYAKNPKATSVKRTIADYSCNIDIDESGGIFGIEVLCPTSLWSSHSEGSEIEAKLHEALQKIERLTDCHAGPGTTTPACEACTACLTRALEEVNKKLSLTYTDQSLVGEIAHVIHGCTINRMSSIETARRVLDCVRASMRM